MRMGFCIREILAHTVLSLFYVRVFLVQIHMATPLYFFFLAVVRSLYYRGDLPIYLFSILIFLLIKHTLISFILFYFSQTSPQFVKVWLNAQNGHLYDQQSHLVVQAVFTSTSLTRSCRTHKAYLLTACVSSSAYLVLSFFFGYKPKHSLRLLICKYWHIISVLCFMFMQVCL